MSDQFAGAVDLSDKVRAAKNTEAHGQDLIPLQSRINPVRETKVVIRMEKGEEQVAVPVIDKFPQMGDVHVEGRRVVELSIEQFMEMMQDLGWTPVLPEGKTK